MHPKNILIIFGFLLLNYWQTRASAAEMFAYDSSIPFDVKETSTKEEDGVTVKDIDYAAHTTERGRMKAYLIRPNGDGPFAGILFFHWLGEPHGDRTQFVEEAVNLAKQGSVALLIEGYFPWKVDPKNGETDRKRVIDETIEVRRALDLLASQPGVDKNRIAFVGHDYGAMYGAITGGIDKRPKAFVLMAPIGSWSDWSLAYWLKKEPEKEKESYRKTIDDVDPVHYVSRISPTPVLLQFATADEHITKEAATAFANAAAQPKEVKWYDTKHHLNVEAARKDRDDWLAKQLNLAPAK